MSLGEDATAPAFLYDLVVAGQGQLPASGLVTAFGILIVGMIAGLEGSGFSGLPLTGSLAGSLADGAGVSSPTLAAIGQMGNIWSGGGTLVAWSSLLAVAGFVAGAGGRTGSAVLPAGRGRPGGLHRVRGGRLRLARRTLSSPGPFRRSGAAVRPGRVSRDEACAGRC